MSPACKARPAKSEAVSSTRLLPIRIVIRTVARRSVSRRTSPAPRAPRRTSTSTRERDSEVLALKKGAEGARRPHGFT